MAGKTTEEAGKQAAYKKILLVEFLSTQIRQELKEGKKKWSCVCHFLKYHLIWS
jgi:hypothetical protein